MFLLSLSNAVIAIDEFVLNGGQFKSILKAIGKFIKGLFKEAPKFADDAARIATKNKGFFASIPGWVWVIIGIVIVGAIIYYVEEN